MKTKALFVASALSLALVPASQADVTINITGSTAFRAVTHASILSVMTGETASRETTSSGSSLLKDVGKICFKGSVAGITGVTTVNCNWNGSVQGMNIVGAGATNGGWIDPATATFTSEDGSGSSHVYAAGAAPKTSVVPTVACSDVYQASTTVTASLESVIGGVIPFKFVASESAAAAITNITDQLHEALWVQGYQQESLFTGNSANTNLVYAVGRDAGSGTRVTRLAETRYGITKPVVQWRVTTSGGVASDVRLWPSTVEEATAPSNMANDPTQQGNGGYTSGGTIATVMGSTSSSVNLRDASNGVIASGLSVSFISHLGLSDAATAIGAGARELTYNGSGYSAANVRDGKYTAWGYLHVLNKTAALSADQVTARNAIVGAFGSNMFPFGASVEAGIDLSTMVVRREEDGGLVGP